jgi:hypothetical protein
MATYYKKSFLTYSTQTERISELNEELGLGPSNLTLDLLLLGLLFSFPYKLTLQ